MEIRFMVRSLAAVAVSAALAAPALADTVKLNGLHTQSSGFRYRYRLQQFLKNYSGGAGQFYGTFLNGSAFATFCTEILKASLGIKEIPY
jgi:hypothetical protein